eukprot:TRINITY_DN95442_c0_g1_i1.p1 TRINITY_DN95442_c0_g1~~TRINITY_DN95442_c0_g1_i1.p1  ORF type:complete len:491 (+),score=97.61 TRINITY_DN95442_c0_g1_i1:32-1474(+)
MALQASKSGLPEGDLERQLKAWRQDFESRKAGRPSTGSSLEAMAHSPSRELKGNLSRTLDFESSAGPRSSGAPAQGVTAGLGRPGAETQLGVPRLGSGEDLETSQSRLSRLLHTPPAPTSPARAFMLNASMSEAGSAWGEKSPSGTLVEPRPQPASSPERAKSSTLSRPVPGSLTGTAGPGMAGAERARLRREQDFPLELNRPPSLAAFTTPSPGASVPSMLLPTAPAAPSVPVSMASVDSTPAVSAVQPPLARKPPVKEEVSFERERAAQRLVEVRRALAEREQELREMDSPEAASQASDVDEDVDAEVWQEGDEMYVAFKDGDEMFVAVSPRSRAVPGTADALTLRQEIEAADARIARLEEQLSKAQLGGEALGRAYWLGASGTSEEAPSDASTAASLPAFTSESHWHQRAQALELELRCQSATAMEIQDRIHWLRAQLRRQPGLQDDRVNSIRNLLADIADQVEAAALSQHSPMGRS